MDETRLKMAMAFQKRIADTRRTIDQLDRALEFTSGSRSDSVKGFSISIIRKHVETLNVGISRDVAHAAIKERREEYQMILEKLMAEFKSI